MKEPWLDVAWQQIMQSLARQTRVQSWCVTHPAGIPVNALMHRLLKRLLCLSPTADDACDRCDGCRFYQNAEHPDLTVLAPEGAARMIKVDAVREAIELAYRTGSLGGSRVIHVAGADALNRASSNALLKVVEEPPERTFFVFDTEAPGRLLPTLVSRLRMIAVRDPEISELDAYAAESGVDPTNLTLAQRLLGEPLAPESNPDRFLLAKQVFEAMQSVKQGQDPAVVAKQFAKSDAVTVLTAVSRVIETCLRTHASPEAGAPLSLAQPLPSEKMLFQLHDRAEEVRRQAAGRIHVNVPMALSTLLAGWAFIWSKV